jgi:hypothetical protein
LPAKDLNLGQAACARGPALSVQVTAKQLLANT